MSGNYNFKNMEEQPVKQSSTSSPTAVSTTGEESDTGILPVNQLMYMNNIYKEEIEHIEKKYGVTMKAEAHVTFQAVNKAGSPNDALYEFTTLVQKSDYSGSSFDVNVSEGAYGGPQLKGYNVHSSFADMGDGATAGDYKEENCPICMDTFIRKTQLKCKHEFCKDCLEISKESMGPMCPVCKLVFGKIEGDQPPGTMTWEFFGTSLPGFPLCGHIAITYHIPAGRQTEKHPNPGKYYSSISRIAYLPDNEEGKEVLHLLKRAFAQKLIFTVGTSRTTGAENQVTWNDIHHKTSKTGGPICFGYPDPNYLSRVKEELKVKGIE